MLRTEMRNTATTHIDTASTQEMLHLIQNENLYAVNAVGNAIPYIVKACDAIEKSMKKGGRLIYIGAGTSGRLGIIDATECPPTFGVEPDRVMGIIAGGKECVFRAAEMEEDNGDAGVKDLKDVNLSSNDVVVGISANGNAAYVINALKYAQSLGCETVGVTSNDGTLLSSTAKYPIITDTGAEAVTGSTRMKAGTAQKLVLNMLSTVAMIKLGNVYENLMINLKAKNKKLLVRMVNIVVEILKISEEEAKNILELNDWNIREAIEYYKRKNL